MSTNISEGTNKTAAVAGSFGLFFLAFFGLGFVGDLASKVDDRGDAGEHITARIAQWTSMLFHVVGSAVIAFFFPLWGITWGLFAAWVLAHRVGARTGFALRTIPLLQFLDVRFRSALGVCVAIPLLAGLTHFGLFTSLSGLSVIGLLALTGIAASRFTLKDFADRQVYGLWIDDLVSVFGVPEKVFERVEMSAYGEGVVINRVPATISVRFDLAAMDAALAKIRPEMQIEPESTPNRIVIDAVSADTRNRRAALLASGGIHQGISDYVPTVITPTVDNHSSADVASHFNLQSQPQSEPKRVTLEGR